MPKRAATKKKPAKKVCTKANTSEQEVIADNDLALHERLKHLQLLPVAGPDSKLISTYNNFLLAWRKYLVDFEADPDGASVTPCDEIGRLIVNMPAHTPEGMLLKINAAAASMGETKTQFPWNGKEFEWDLVKHSAAGQIEYDLIDKLRDDIRRLQRPAPITGVSPDLAALLKIWKPLDEAANEAMKAADVDPPDPNLTSQMNRAIQAEQNIRFAILNTRARSFADIAAKFSIVGPYADLEDWPAMVEENKTCTEGMLWSICGDLLALPSVTIAAPDCRAAELADRFRKAVEQFDAFYGRAGAEPNPRDRRLLDQLMQRQIGLMAEASQERASTVKGALFQLGVIASLMDQAISNTSWREKFDIPEGVAFDPPDETKALQRDIYRLLFSAAKAIAQIHGIAEKEYAADYFLNIDPFEA